MSDPRKYRELADIIDDDEQPAPYASQYASYGAVEPGNIDLVHRPRVRNPDGSVSTVRSMGVGFDDVEYLLPTVSEDGRIMSNEEAIEQFKRTNRHMGGYKDVAASNRAAQRIHEDQARILANPLTDPAELEKYINEAIGSHYPGFKWDPRR